MQSVFGRVARSTVGQTKDHTRADAPVGERGIALNRYPDARPMGTEWGAGCSHRAGSVAMRRVGRAHPGRAAFRPRLRTSRNGTRLSGYWVAAHDSCHGDG